MLMIRVCSGIPLLIAPALAQPQEIGLRRGVSGGAGFALLTPAAGLQGMTHILLANTAHILAGLAGVLVLACAARRLMAHFERRQRRAIQMERERLAMELHDTLAQSFAGIAFQLQAARDEAADPPLRSQLESALAMVRRTHVEIKHTMAAMYSPVLGGRGNPADALRQFAEERNRNRSLVIRSSCRGAWRRLSPAAAEGLYRIGQEAIMNSLRHAEASRIDITLVIADHTAQLCVQDNGCGFDADPCRFGLGLQGLEKRTAQISGRLQLASAPGAGTSLMVTVGLSRARRRAPGSVIAFPTSRERSRWQAN